MMKVDWPSLGVTIPYPGAQPEQVEKEVSIPAEGILKTVPGLRQITSASYDGRCRVGLRFDWGADMAVAAAEVRDRLERLRLQLPPEVEHIVIQHYTNMNVASIRFALSREERGEELALFARTYLQRRLLRLDGVAMVELTGTQENIASVEFNQDALYSLGLSMQKVIAALQSSSLNLGLGELDEGAMRYSVRLQGEFTQPEDLENAQIGATGLHIKDVANVTIKPPKTNDYYTMDGKKGIFFRVIKEEDANTVKVCDAVRAMVTEAMKEPELAGTQLYFFDDLSSITRFAMRSLYNAAIFGCLLSVVVLFVFLWRARITLLVAMAIPASMVFSLIYIYFSGGTLNVVTMAAMLVAIGMLVDNAIVVVENIHRHKDMGEDPLTSTFHGAAEVGMAITASTMTTIIVFVPIYYLEEGELSLVMREFAGPMTSALLGSLVIALTLLPLAEAHMDMMSSMRIVTWIRHRLPERLHRAAQQRKRPFAGFYTVFARTVELAMRRPAITLGLLGLFLLATYLVPFKQTGFNDFPELDSRQIQLRFSAYRNCGEEAIKAKTEEIVATLEAHRDELGIQHIYVARGLWGASVNCFLIQPGELAPGKKIPCGTPAARERLAKLFAYYIPEGTINCGVAQTSAADSSSTYRVRIGGSDRATLMQLAETLKTQMESLPEFEQVKVDKPDDNDEIQLDVDEIHAAAAGTSPMMVARSVNYALAGANLPYLKLEGREMPVRGILEGIDRQTIGDLETMHVPGAKGQLTPLTQVANLRKGATPPSVYRVDTRASVDIVGRTTASELSQVRDALEKLADRFSLPVGYTITLDENIANMKKTVINFRDALIMALVLIYLVMAALFESWLLPLSVLTTVPVAFTGVYWAMYLTNTPMDTISLAGAIVMCGVIVNNGIVIIDHINQLRAKGMPRAQAVVQGSQDRLRPVLMTALTTIVGIVPITIGGETGGSVLLGIGRALVGGFTVGTFLTLYIVPIAYIMIDDLRLWFQDYFAGFAAFGKPRA